MSVAVADLERSTTERTPSIMEIVQRDAFYLDSEGQPLFAWLHHSADQTGFDHGVVICPPIGYEQLHSHRSLRHLADRLAYEHIPTLRFDWHGTGDSAGVDEDPNRLDTWLANVRDTVQWMRERLGCRQISVIGLRLGGTLAAVAATQLEVDNLVLWAPVSKGRAYVREMKAIGLTAETTPRVTSNADSDGRIEAAGFVLSAETAAGLSQLDLLKSDLLCRRVLLVSRDDLPEDDRLSDHLAATGICVEKITVPGFAEMMLDPHRSQVPQRAIGEMTKWLVRQISLEATTTSMIDINCEEPTTALMASGTNGFGNEVGQHMRESAVRFSSKPDLFGIVCEPAASLKNTDLITRPDTAPNDLPLIVLLNAGSSYRVGPSRLYVFLARQLAAQGFRSVRLDFCSLGDSVSPDTQHENAPYPATAFRDVELILKDLEQRFGTRKIVLMGLCSGAYAAFQSAVQIQNPVLVESVLINPLTFFWKEGMSLEISPVKQLVSIHYYIESALQPAKWLKLLSGQSRIGVIGAMKIVLRRLRLLSLSTPATQSRSSDCSLMTELGHPQREDLSGDLDRIVRRGRKLSMFFAATDPGFSILTFYAKRKVNQLRRARELSISFIADADHTFTMQYARQELSQSILGYLNERYRKPQSLE